MRIIGPNQVHRLPVPLQARMLVHQHLRPGPLQHLPHRIHIMIAQNRIHRRTLRQPARQRFCPLGGNIRHSMIKTIIPAQHTNVIRQPACQCQDSFRQSLKRIRMNIRNPQYPKPVKRRRQSCKGQALLPNRQIENIGISPLPESGHLQQTAHQRLQPRQIFPMKPRKQPPPHRMPARLLLHLSSLSGDRFHDCVDIPAVSILHIKKSA